MIHDGPSIPSDPGGGFLTRAVELFLRGDVATLVVVVSLLLGLAALLLTPREEEPQIVVPLADVFVEAPGLSAVEVEQQVTRRLEKLLYQIDGVEYVYSMSQTGRSVVTVRFYVGENREDSLIKLHNKLNSSLDEIPPGVQSWVVKPIEVDDVPIVIATLWTDNVTDYSDHELRRLAEEIQHDLQAIPNTNRVRVMGGRPRRIRVELDARRMAARQTSPLDIVRALEASNFQLRSGQFEQQDQQFIVDGGTFLTDIDGVRNLVVSVTDNRPVYLKDLAHIHDGPAEVDRHSWIGFGPADKERTADGQLFPAVHIAVAKRKGTNAVWVANAVERKLEELSETHLPEGVHFRITRDYGETANEKVNELVEGLAIAVITVIGLIGLTIGWRAALVIAIAIPVCYSLTLFVNLLVGYTINRVTMFALILSLGLLVDDPITDVENIARYFAMRVLPPRESVLRAIQEVRPALILSTLAIIASFLPLVFITGMMGPYMAPMALNVPLTVTISTVVAFILTPWMAMAALRRLHERGDSEEPFDLTRRPLYRLSQTLIGPLLGRRWLSWSVLGIVALLLSAAMLPPLMRQVPLKMLPYDNKNEFQVVIDMPEGTTLSRTDAVARRLATFLAGEAEVRDFEVYVGFASPMDFNGMVRHYFLRQGPNVADIRVNLAPKHRRAQQSHEILLRIRRPLTELAESLGANVKLVEVPPGPPVIATITAEVYGPPHAPYDAQIAAAKNVQQRMEKEAGVVDVDISAEHDQVRWIFETDKAKAALSGVSTETVARTLQLALDGLPATVLHVPHEVDPLHIELRLPRSHRSSLSDLEQLYVRGEEGQIVQLAALGRFVETEEDKTIYHKNLRRVVYVYGEVAGRPPADAIIDMQLDRVSAASETALVSANPPREADDRTWLTPGGGDPWSMPAGFNVQWAGEGEWKITLDVFRDLGLAFGAALVGIFVILMFQTGSRILPILIMLAIPLTMIGIMPGFWALNLLWNQPLGGYPNPVFFTATAMIGMIALAGIVVRNSVVLIDFIHMAQAEGLPLREAIIRSVAVRTRPILLTAGTTLLGNWVITLDPVFSGLAWAIIFGILSSTLFTLVVIPVTYWLLYSHREEPLAATTETQS
jgi:multidrug efflux pump subunit AcrB